MGPMIREADADRVRRGYDAAVAGARVLVAANGAARSSSPPCLADVDPACSAQEELFGPAVAVSTAADWERRSPWPTTPRTGCRRASSPGTSPGGAAIREIDSGNVHINWRPLWRADLMPYGGLKGSGIGKEGPRRAVAEMTEEKTVVLHGRPW